MMKNVRFIKLKDNENFVYDEILAVDEKDFEVVKNIIENTVHDYYSNDNQEYSLFDCLNDELKNHDVRSIKIDYEIEY